MSVEAIALVLHHSQADGSDKLVLIGIANHHGDEGAWPSIDTLAKYANRSRRAVQASVSRLVELGELEVEVNEGGTHHTDPRRRPNRYRILIVCPGDCDRSMNHRSGVQPTTPLDDHGVQSSASRGAADSTLGVQPTAPEPSLEPEGEPSPFATFDDFWAKYPRKTGKDAARRAYKTALKRARPIDIDYGLMRSIEYWRVSRTEKRFIPHPATWLNQGRWQDELERPAAPNEDAVKVEVIAAIERGDGRAAWQLILGRAAALGHTKFVRVANMLGSRQPATIALILQVDPSFVADVQALYDQVVNGDTSLELPTSEP